jgi:aminoglycoside phosphotransferase (APT) family kinase protein
MASGARDMPAAEVDIDAARVRSLLGSQHPDLAGRSIDELSCGWDNVIFRLGDDLVVRLPRRQAAAQLVEHEQRWLPELGPRLPLAIPTPLRVGRPEGDYPWSWSVCRWMPGGVAATHPPTDPPRAAQALGGFLRALHVEAPPDAPPNPWRGIPLGDRAHLFDEHLASVSSVDDVAVRALWHASLDLPPWPRPPVWLHGDLHPANLLVHDGVISAVIDFGDITSGDPATDLAIAWMLFAPEDRQVFRESAGDVDDDTWSRARGWALALSLAYLAHSADNPLMRGIGEHTLATVLADS